MLTIITIDYTDGTDSLADHPTLHGRAAFASTDSPERYVITLEADDDGGWTVNDNSDADATHHATHAEGLRAFLHAVATQIDAMDDKD